MGQKWPKKVEKMRKLPDFSKNRAIFGPLHPGVRFLGPFLGVRDDILGVQDDMIPGPYTLLLN